MPDSFKVIGDIEPKSGLGDGWLELWKQHSTPLDKTIKGIYHEWVYLNGKAAHWLWGIEPKGGLVDGQLELWKQKQTPLDKTIKGTYHEQAYINGKATHRLWENHLVFNMV